MDLGLSGSADFFSLGTFSAKEIELAGLIGLLHDIARFEQFTKYQTFNDRLSFDHGD